MEFLLGVLILSGLLFCWFIFPFILRRFSEARLARLCKDKKAIVLSYDDGPGPDLTQRLLALLKGRGLASFFVLGRSAEVNGDIVSQAIQDGHEVGSHSFHHTNAWKVGPLRATRDLAAGVRMVQSLGGNATLYRPPYGKLTLATLIGSLLRRQRFGWWTIDSKDTNDSNERRRIDGILDEISQQGGGVVLMHDFDRPPGSEEGIAHTDYVLNLTTRIIEFAEQNGYRLMRLGDVLGHTQQGVLK